MKLERKEIDPPSRLDVDGHDDLRHFHEEFTNMNLPRSVKEMAKEDFQPRRCESDTFRGFSFIQRDFALPERPDHEYEKYWNSPDADGESLSECASSVFDDDMGGGGEKKPSSPEQRPPEKKKRPPRKKKKKQKPLEDVPEGKKEEGGNGDGSKEKKGNAEMDPTTGERRLTLDEIQDMMAGAKVEEKKSEKMDEPPTAAAAPKPTASAAKPKLAPPPKKKEAPKWDMAGKAAAPKGAKSTLTAQAVPFRPAGAGGVPQRSAHQALPQARPTAAAPSPAAPPQRAPQQYRPAPGSWAAKMAQSQPAALQQQRGWGAPPPKGPVRPQAPAPPPPPPPPPPSIPHSNSNRSLGSMGSSDWRNHDMSPGMGMSPRRKAVVKMPPPAAQGAEKFWPALGGDFPAPPLAAGKKAGGGATTVPKGSWAKGAGGNVKNKVASSNTAWGAPG